MQQPLLNDNAVIFLQAACRDENFMTLLEEEFARVGRQHVEATSCCCCCRVEQDSAQAKKLR